jgi:cell division septal protein FtsQ
MGSAMSATRAPGVVPRTAVQRRRRNKGRVHFPTVAVKRFVFTSRWLSGGLLALCLYALIVIGSDDRFRLTTIPVEGAVSIPPSEVVGASGLAGRHVFSVDPGKAAEAINQLPGVITATVTLAWPNQVAISLSEEKPIAVWEQGDQQFWINEDGQLIPARLNTEGLLIIAGDSAETLGDLNYVPLDVLNGALQLRQLRPNIDRLTYRPSDGLSYQDGRGWQAFFGAGTDMAQKLVVYETIVADLVERGLAPVYISVSNQSKPYYRALGEG